MTLNEMFEEHGIYLGSIAFRAVEDVVKSYIQQELGKERLLEKENAELKSEMGCETCTKFDEVRLAEAKEIIRECLPALKHGSWWKLHDKAEAFLKEAENA